MNIVLDLDGTLVFAQPAEIAIAGRSRCSYVSAQTASLLESLGARGNLYLASARHAASVAGLVRALPRVRFAGFVLEGGLVWRGDIHAPPTPSLVQQALMRRLRNRQPDWQVVAGYEQMVCCIAPAASGAALEQARRIVNEDRETRSWETHQERHKTFAYPQKLCKVAGLRKLAVNAIDFAAGDDAIYDHSLLASATVPLTLAAADPEIRALVRARGGFIATATGHQAARQILQHIHDCLDSGC